MNTGSLQPPVSVADYLVGEQDAQRRHEYVEGFIYMLAGATNAHNRIATNATGSLYAQLRGNPCQVFNSDTKIRVQTSTGTRFYYPDAMVACRQNPDSDTFQDDPVVIVEVLSQNTRRTDENEKKDTYCSIASVRVYLLVEQSSATVTVLRRTDAGFVTEHLTGLDAVIPLPEIGVALPCQELYENVDFQPEPPLDPST